MPDPDGYEYWPIDAATPDEFPVAYPNVVSSGDTAAEATCQITVPVTSCPSRKSRAETSVGISSSWKLSFALRAEKNAAGQVTSQHVLCIARHVNWFPDHPETGPGTDVIVRLDQADIGAVTKVVWGSNPHGPHHDLVRVIHTRHVDGKLHLSMSCEHGVTSAKGMTEPAAPTPGGGPAPHQPGPGTPVPEPSHPGTPPEPPHAEPKPPPEKPQEPTPAHPETLALSEVWFYPGALVARGYKAMTIE